MGLVGKFCDAALTHAGKTPGVPSAVITDKKAPVIMAANNFGSQTVEAMAVKMANINIVTPRVKVQSKAPDNKNSAPIMKR